MRRSNRLKFVILHLTNRYVAIGILLIVLIAAMPQFLFPYQTVRVGYTEINGFQTITPQGDYIGYNTEILKVIAKRNRWKLEYIEDSFDNLYEKLRNNEIDILGGVTEVNNVRREVSFTQYSTGGSSSVIVSRSIHSYLNNYGILANKTIGFMKNSRAYSEFEQIADRLLFDFTPVFFERYDSLLSALDAGILDAASFSSMYAFDSSMLIAQHSLMNYYFVTSHENTNILKQLDHALGWIHSKMPGFYTELHTHFYEKQLTTPFEFSGIRHKREIVQLFALVFICAVIIFIGIQLRAETKEERKLRKLWWKAMRNDEAKVSFTPIASYYDLRTAMYTIDYYWESPEFGILPKAEIIRLAGNAFKIFSKFHEFKVTMRSIHMVRQLEEYRNAKFIIHMHASYANWRSILLLKFLLSTLMHAYSVPGEVLVFSFSSAIVHDKKTKYSVSNACKPFGISFLMNDFGLQFSSLSQIKEINYAFFKVDRIYTSDFYMNDVSLQIIKLIVNIAASLEREVIIDGIDNEEIYERAKSLQCHYLQGKMAGNTMTLDQLLEGHHGR